MRNTPERGCRTHSLLSIESNVRYTMCQRVQHTGGDSCSKRCVYNSRNRLLCMCRVIDEPTIDPVYIPASWSSSSRRANSICRPISRRSSTGAHRMKALDQQRAATGSVSIRRNERVSSPPIYVFAVVLIRWVLNQGR